MTETDNIQAVINTARDTTPPQSVQAGKLYLTPSGDGGREVWDFTGDEYLNQPKRKTGNVYVDDLNSFLVYFRKHSTPASEIYVNVDKAQITAVLDAHTRDGADWGQHRLILRMTPTDRWADWTKHDRTAFKQVAFAEYIEDHLDDILNPNAATMLEIASTLEASTKVKFSSGVTLSNGSRRLNWEETTDARAGESGKFDVPTQFTIRVAPFDFANAAEVNARFRYRVASGDLSITYLLDDPAAVVRDAVLDVIKNLETSLTPEGGDQPSHQVMRGTPTE
ncbi:DUF2303 family protein [Actinomadura sp. GTD37]|uniref:DUF2303 family protein n=1 Tax=Actinomadura sp. GTD37 TaxID=1778030 RepID=UPI0035C20AA0